MYILHQNINGLITKSDILTVCLDDISDMGKEVDILCCTEHNMISTDVELLDIPNFSIGAHFTRDSRDGGSCILVRNGIKFRTLDELSQFNICNVMETCAIELTDLKLIVVCIYRIPKKKNKKYYFNLFFHNLNGILSVLTRNKNNKLIICGDFNINLLKKTQESTKFRDIISYFDLRFSVNKVTRPSSGTCLDNIIHNIRKAKTELLELAVSDHKAQLMKCPVNKTFPCHYWFCMKRDYSSENLLKFKNYISQLSFGNIYDIKNGEIAYTEFLDIFKLIFDLCFPIVRRKNFTRRKPKWISKGIKICSKRKRSLLWKYRTSKNDNDRLDFQKYAATFNKIIKLTQKAQNDHYIYNSENKGKATWSIIKQNKHNLPKESISQLDIDKRKIRDPKLIAQAFNDYYIDLPLTSSVNITDQRQNCNNHSYNSIFLKPTDPQEVYTIIKHLKNTNSTGIDDISTKAIKEVSYHIAPVLSHIINICLEEGVFAS